MRTKIIIGNWKMNNGPKEAHTFIHELEEKLKGKKLNVEFAIAPPFTSIPFMFPHSHGDEKPFEIPLAAQNFHWEKNGAFTGEISIDMLNQLGVDYAIIGHSERRQMFGETDKTVNLKLLACLTTPIIPVVAYGETLEQFEEGKTIEVITSQLEKALENVPLKDFRKIILAYEPIWAIGTGKTATAQQAQDVISKSREFLAIKFGQDAANSIRILYGGSVNKSNIKDLLSQKDIDGALVGGASLKASDFADLLI